jgi:hypothetical protein
MEMIRCRTVRTPLGSGVAGHSRTSWFTRFTPSSSATPTTAIGRMAYHEYRDAGTGCTVASRNPSAPRTSPHPVERLRREQQHDRRQRSPQLSHIPPPRPYNRTACLCISPDRGRSVYKPSDKFGRRRGTGGRSCVRTGRPRAGRRTVGIRQPAPVPSRPVWAAMSPSGTGAWCRRPLIARPPDAPGRDRRAGRPPPAGALLRCEISGRAALGAGCMSDRWGEFGERRGNPQRRAGLGGEFVVAAAEGSG